MKPKAQYIDVIGVISFWRERYEMAIHERNLWMKRYQNRLKRTRKRK